MYMKIIHNLKKGIDRRMGIAYNNTRLANANHGFGQI